MEDKRSSKKQKTQPKSVEPPISRKSKRIANLKEEQEEPEVKKNTKRSTEHTEPLRENKRRKEKNELLTYVLSWVFI
jgi:hypothetical protein